MTTNTRYYVTVTRTETKSIVVSAPTEQDAIDMAYEIEIEEPNSPLFDRDCDTAWYGEEVEP